MPGHLTDEKIAGLTNQDDGCMPYAHCTPDDCKDTMIAMMARELQERRANDILRDLCVECDVTVDEIAMLVRHAAALRPA